MAVKTEIAQDTQRDAIIARLKRVEGQLRGVQRMVADEEACEKVAQQLSAARRALDRAFYSMIACRVEQELARTNNDDAGMRQALSHVTGILAKYG